MLESFGWFVLGLVIGEVSGCIVGTVLYWYLIVHRKKVSVPEDIKPKISL